MVDHYYDLAIRPIKPQFSWVRTTIAEASGGIPEILNQGYDVPSLQPKPTYYVEGSKSRSFLSFNFCF